MFHLGPRLKSFKSAVLNDSFKQPAQRRPGKGQRVLGLRSESHPGTAKESVPD